MRLLTKGDLKHVRFPLDRVEVETTDNGDRWEKNGVYLFAKAGPCSGVAMQGGEVGIHLNRQEVEAIIRTWSEFCGDNDESAYVTMLYEPSKS